MNNENKFYAEELIKDLKSALYNAQQKYGQNGSYYRFEEPYVKEGINISNNTCRQLPYVNPSPWMSLLAKFLGDRKYDRQTEKWSKISTGQDTKCVEIINKYVNESLAIICPNASSEYDHSKPLDSIDHYFTDCLNGWKAKIWDIQPGQAKERSEVFKQYQNPVTQNKTETYIKNNFAEFLASLQIFESLLPQIQDRVLVVGELSAPFQSKGTGTSYPFYKNDRTVVKVEQLKTYHQFLKMATYIFKDTNYSVCELKLIPEETMGNFCIRAVTAAFDRLPIRQFCNLMSLFNTYTGYPRNQRGKGRALEAMSRLVNLAVNILEAQELESWKQSPSLGTAFQRREIIKERLIKLVELCNKYDLICVNEDSSGWDRNVQPLLIAAQSLLRDSKFPFTNQRVTREIGTLRLACATKSRLLANNRSSSFYGRTGSGYDDTTLQNSSVHWIIANTFRAKAFGIDKLSKLYNDPDFVKYSCYIVGDDICAAVPRNKRELMIRTYDGLGQTIHEDEKSIYGPMFIQWRLFKLGDKYVISYNFPRVIRSCCSKEDEKELGVGGWIMSAYSTCANCMEYIPGLLSTIVWIIKCDPYSLLLEYDIEVVKHLVTLEDNATASKTSTFERVTGKNPQSNAGIDDWDTDFLRNFQNVCRQAIDGNPELVKELVSIFNSIEGNKVDFNYPQYVRDALKLQKKVWRLPDNLKCNLITNDIT